MPSDPGQDPSTRRWVSASTFGIGVVIALGIAFTIGFSVALKAMFGMLHLLWVPLVGLWLFAKITKRSR